MKALITGGCGFFGHHFIEHLLINTDWELVVLDRLSYASSGFDRLREIGAYTNPRLKVFTADIRLPIEDGLADEIGEVDYIFHLAAETHVDNSIKDPWPFIQSNVIGTFNMLEYARQAEALFFYFSTDEVFGPAITGYKFDEWDRYKSGNPYSATKAAGEELCLAWQNTYGVPVTITHCMNLIGERQHGEKFLPLCIRKILAGDVVTIHASPDKTQAGSRGYIHARNAADALLYIAENPFFDKVNIAGQREIDNLKLAQGVAAIIGKPFNYELVDFHSSRPGHDLRYALDGGLLKRAGWEPPVSFEQSLLKTINWYLENKNWLEVKDGSHRRRSNGQGGVHAADPGILV